MKIETEKIYNKYDAGEIKDTDASYMIIDLLTENHPETKTETDKLYNEYDAGGSSSDMLMNLMDIVERF